MKQGKTWGVTREILSRNGVQGHHISVVAGGYCSWHSHRYKWNEFYVIKGCLWVTELKRDTGTKDVTILHAGDSCVVPPGNGHRFEGIEGTEAIEFYYTELNANDIVRKDAGGIRNVEQDKGEQE